MGNPAYYTINSDQNNTSSWDAENYAGPTHAQTSEDSEFWYFGVVETAEGVVLVLDIADSYKICASRTLAIAGDLCACYIVYGQYDFLAVFVKHVSGLLGTSLNTAEEATMFFNILSNNYSFLYWKHLQYAPVQASAITGPTAHKYPSNVSEDARRIWDSIFDSSKYKAKSEGTTTLQKWNIVTRMFLDKCSRLGIHPFEVAKKSKTLEALNKKYVDQRNLAAHLERQVFHNLVSEGLVEDLDRGVWKFSKTAYIDKRYAIILETRWLSLTRNPALLAKHIVGEEHFVKSATGGWEHNVSPTCKLQIRIKRYPDINFKMILLLSKDLVLDLGVTGRNSDEILESFDEIARDWARTRRFHKVKKVSDNEDT